MPPKTGLTKKFINNMKKVSNTVICSWPKDPSMNNWGSKFERKR